MASVQKITLSASRDIPFNKLVLSQANVRRVKAGVSIEELADDIARRTLLQSLSVRPVLDTEGNETGMFEVVRGPMVAVITVAGLRIFSALSTLGVRL
jgi:ParB family transcriptional regulator, chromosome partitioning protein